MNRKTASDSRVLTEWGLTDKDVVTIYNSTKSIASDLERMAAIRAHVAMLAEARGQQFSPHKLYDETPHLASDIQFIGFWATR